MSVGVRHLTVLRQFRPFALTVEEADGDLPESGAVSASFVQEKYQYYLFGSEITRETSSDPRRSTGIDISGDESEPSSSDLGEHELFVRDNRIIWSMGTRVYKRYTAQSAVIMVCWCRMDSISEPLLCALQTDYLTLYTSQGDEFCVPLPYYVTSIFPLKSGLLLQKAADVSRAILQSSPPLHRKEISRSRDHGFNPFKPLIRDDPALISSHLVLKHPLEEPQATYFEERGKLSLMKDFDEKTIWTSDQIPLMASYNRSKFQHSVWNIDNVGPTLSIPSELSSHQLAFQRIWQGKCSQSPASKVFLGTDIDATPVLCLLFSDQKLLLGIRLQIDEDNHEGFFDIKPLNSWSIPAIDVTPIIVTRPRVKSGILPFTDILVLTPENDLFLYSGNQCLCRYILPDNLVGHGLCEPKIIGVKDSVQGRINVFCNDNQVYRCILRKYPCSSLVKDCLTAMSEGLNSSFYAHFLSLLWSDNNSSYLSHSDSHPDQEWESFINEMIKLCNKLGLVVSKRKDSVLSNGSAWGFLLDSGFHARYQKKFSGSFLSISPNNEDSVMSNYSCNYENKENIEEVNYYTGLVKETLDSLHALYESLKLNILRKQDVENLAGLLINISAALNETNYIDYYTRDFPCLSPTISLPKNYKNTPPTNPPCLFRFLESCLQKGGKTVKNSTDIPNLVTTSKSSVLGWARKVVLFYKLLLGVESEEIKMKIKLSSSRSNKDEITILSMVHEKFGRQHLDLLPVGVSLPLRHVLDKCREEPPYDWPASAYVLIGREDLAMQHGSQSSSAADLVSSSVPYMLHLQPVTVPSSASDPTGTELSSSDDPEGRNVEDGMEHIFNSTTQLRFGRDLRLNEARRLLCSAKPVAVPMSVNPSANDQEVQQHKLWNLAQRTTALPFGRGAFTLATTYTLLTEALVIPKLVLAGRLPAQQNATVNLDPNVRNVSELSSWPDFHNGVAAGLRLAPFQGKMARTWILYNRPDEANYTHAGLLLALGLHGHLQVLSTTDVYRYLSQEHDITSASLLLGLAASNRGTMNAEISKTLNVHIPRHPASLEFELPTLLQSSALMAIGLLYEGSAHPLTMKMLLGEIGRKSGSDNVLEWEGYAVAAGSALGLVALGRGGDAFGFAESFVDRLFDYIGTKGFYSLSDGKQVNFYVTAPGATIALALIFLKTEVEEIANKLQIPATQYDLKYVRPDFIMLRIIARNLIMWTRIQPSREWIESQVPEFIRIAIVKTGEDSINGDDYESEALFQAYVNIVTGACISLGLKYAGTRNGDVQELLYNYAIYFLNEMKNIGATSALKLPKGLLQQVDRATLELCVHLVVLSLTLVMAGSGHLQTLRLLRYLRSRSSAEGHINYGLQMAVSLGIGFLFLGSGMQTFSTQNSAIAALLITLYPRLPTGPNDNRCHLQAFRHFYVLATESRWIQTVDVDTGLPVYCPIEISVKETLYYSETTFCEVTPCLLPERSVLKSIRVCGPRYWSQFIELEPEDKGWWRVGDKKNPFNGGLIYIKRKVGSCSYSDDPVGCQSLLSRAMHKVSGAWGMGAPGPGENLNSLKVDQLVSTFSSDPSLIAFAKLCCDSSPHQSFDSNFQEFCSQVLYECVSKDRPALLQVYLCFYTMIEAISVQVRNGSSLIQDSIFISSLKVGLAYSEALVKDGLNQTNGGGIIQHKFIESLRKRIEDSLSISQGIKENLVSYLNEQEWPSEINKADKVLLSWYLLWYNIPSPRIVSSALDKVRNNEVFSKGFSMVPLLKLLFPGTHLEGLVEIEKFRVNLGR